jgi:hypothetical protein
MPFENWLVSRSQVGHVIGHSTKCFVGMVGIVRCPCATLTIPHSQPASPLPGCCACCIAHQVAEVAIRNTRTSVTQASGADGLWRMEAVRMVYDDSLTLELNRGPSGVCEGHAASDHMSCLGICLCQSACPYMGNPLCMTLVLVCLASSRYMQRLSCSRVGVKRAP